MKFSAPIVLALLLFMAHSTDAFACGGLFCSSVNQLPVSQNSERILFEVDNDGRVTATVDIQYVGAPENFAWIIPVSEVPDLVDVAPVSALRTLDAATIPQISLPQNEQCPQSTSQFLFGGIQGCVACDEEFATIPRDAQTLGVRVTDLPTVGPFEPEVIDALSLATLVQWLEANDYLVTPEMHPLLEQYVSEGYKFLGLKLVPDASVRNIQPIVFSCPSGAPTIPLRLTALASEPEMGITVFVAGAQRYASSNFRTLDVPQERVHASPYTWRNNYYPLISKIVDEQGGKAFVTEFAGLTESLVVPSVNAQNDEWVNGLLARQPFLTRLFTRISAHEMDEDPIFMANGNADLPNQIDLSTRVAAAQCAGSVLSQACALTYCGEGATCATDELGAEGCVCADGDVAREITAPDFTLQVVCQPEGDFLGEIDENVCEQNSCGENGSCVAVEGFATCRCDEGFFASNTSGRLECLAIAEEFIDDVDWPEDFYATPAEMVASRALNLGANPFVMFGVLLLAGKAWRWRRRLAIEKRHV